MYKIINDKKIIYTKINKGLYQGMIVDCFWCSFWSQLALCTAALLPELQPAPCFLSAIIGQTD